MYMYMMSNTVSSFEMLQKPERQTSIEEKRKYVVAELLETEKSYVEALKMIQEVSTYVEFDRKVKMEVLVKASRVCKFHVYL